MQELIDTLNLYRCSEGFEEAAEVCLNLWPLIDQSLGVFVEGLAEVHRLGPVLAKGE